MQKTTSDKASFAFRWRYVALPVFMAVVSAALGAVFRARLPFPTAYFFAADGSPDAFAIPELFIFWVLFFQSGLALGAITVTWAVSWLARRFLRPEAAAVSPQKIMMLTGNMVALPQVIILYYMLDVFLYNTGQGHLPVSVLVFALIVMLAGGVVLGFFLLQMVRQAWGANRKVL
jgi:hypothetical protein